MKVVYKTLQDHYTIMDALKEINSIPYTEESFNNVWDYVDSLEHALFVTYLPWRASKVRSEQDSIVRKRRKKYPNDKCDLCDISCKPELHHIIPVACGGGNDDSNVIFLCSNCHKKQKSDLLKLGRQHGDKLITDKSVYCKNVILQNSSEFGGNLSDKDLIGVLGIARNTFYKYKKELKEVQQNET